MNGKLEKLAVVALSQALAEPRIPQHLPAHVRMAIAKKHNEKKQALSDVLPLIATHSIMAKMLGKPLDLYFIEKTKRHPLEIYGLTTKELKEIMGHLTLGKTEAQTKCAS